MTSKLRSFPLGPWQHDGGSIVADAKGRRFIGFFDHLESAYLVTQAPALYQSACWVVLYMADRLAKEIVPPIELLFPVALSAAAIMRAQSWERLFQKELTLLEGCAPGPFALNPSKKLIMICAGLLREKESAE